MITAGARTKTGLVGEGRDPVLLGEDLDHVGHHLEQAERARRGSARSGPARAPAAGAPPRSACRATDSDATSSTTTMSSRPEGVVHRRCLVRADSCSSPQAGKRKRRQCPASPTGSAATPGGKPCDNPDRQPADPAGDRHLNAPSRLQRTSAFASSRVQMPA